MFLRPSSRRKSAKAEINLNLIPILDTLVTLISFLLLTSTFIAITVISTPAPLLAPAEEQLDKLKKEKPLQLTAYIFQEKVVISDWTGSRELHTIPNTTHPDSGELQINFEKLHEVLISIKQRHPTETKLILKPEPGVSYETLVGLMDHARSIEKTDPPLYKKNAQGIDEPEQNLFPEIIFGNLMS